MNEREELTADQLDWLRRTNCGEEQGYAPIVRKLLAAYDAALARAEAADYGRWYNNAVQERVRRVAAESRLAEATALLGRWTRALAAGRRDLQGPTRAFLSHTPAPAAESEPEYGSHGFDLAEMRAQAKRADRAEAGCVALEARIADLEREIAAARESFEELRTACEHYKATTGDLRAAIDAAIRDMLSGGHPFEAGVAKAINDLRAAQKAGT